MNPSVMAVANWAYSYLYPVEIVEEEEVCGESKLNLLVFVNPASGSGQALRDFERDVAPIFRKNGARYTLFVTERAGHCTKFLSKKDHLEGYDGLIGVGGDGIISEIVQGLCASGSMECVVGHIPSGSGNGLAKSLLVLAGRSYGVKEAAEMICTGKSIKMDLMYVKSEGRTFPSFLTFNWGSFYDLDIGTEYLRSVLGGHRFVVGAILEVLKGKAHKGTLSYQTEKSSKFKKVTGPFSFILACNTTHCSYNAETAPGMDMQDGKVRLTWVLHCNRWTLLQIFLGLEDGSYLKCPKVHQAETSAFQFTPKFKKVVAVDGEVVKTTKIQAKVEKQALTVFCDV